MQINEEAIRQEAERMSRGFRLIGEFIFNFSQLEFTLRFILANELKLSEKQFDAVTAPYDFAMLCKVLQTILVQKTPAKEAWLEEFFKECYALNNERVRVAHGTWADNGHMLTARHVARNSLKGSFHYQNPADLEKLIARTAELMQQSLTLSSAVV